jgi:hypothetical protein
MQASMQACQREFDASIDASMSARVRCKQRGGCDRDSEALARQRRGPCQPESRCECVPFESTVTAGNSLYEQLGTAYACISWEKLIRDELFRVTARVRWDHGMVTVVCSDAQLSGMVCDCRPSTAYVVYWYDGHGRTAYACTSWEQLTRAGTMVWSCAPTESWYALTYRGPGPGSVPSYVLGLTSPPSESRWHTTVSESWYALI